MTSFKKSNSERHVLAKVLMHNSFTLRELNNRIVNGRNSHGPVKEPLCTRKIYKDIVFKSYPCLGSEVGGLCQGYGQV